MRKITQKLPCQLTKLLFTNFPANLTFNLYTHATNYELICDSCMQFVMAALVLHMFTILLRQSTIVCLREFSSHRHPTIVIL